MWKWLLFLLIALILAVGALWYFGRIPEGLVFWSQSEPHAGASSEDAKTTALAPNQKPEPASQGPGWTVNCKARTGDKRFGCNLAQTVVIKGSGELLANVMFHLPEEGAPKLSIQLPLGVYVPAGTTMQIDQNEARTIQLKSCNRRGCFADLSLSTEEIGRLRTAEQLKIGFKNLAQKTITLPLSLGGFDRAYAKAKNAQAL